MLNRFELFGNLTKVVESAILLISDMQLITSLAILISGYVQLFGGISLYHWSTIVDLAWFSALTHLATLTSLRHFFRSRPIMATCRVLVMGLILVLLSVAFVPTGFESQRFLDIQNPYHEQDPRYYPHEYFVSVPTLCLYSTSSTKDALAGFDTAVSQPGAQWSSSISNTFNIGLVGISIAFLLISYITRVIRIYTPLSQIFEKWLRLVPMDFLQKRYRIAKDKRPLPKRRLVNFFHKAILLVMITLAEAFYEIGDSMLWEILWLSSAVAWGTLRLVGLRQDTSLVGEASWGFGQVLALSLCVLPIWDFLNTFFGSKEPSSLPNAGSGTGSAGQNQRNFLTLEELKKTTWFRSLTVLIVGMAAVFAAGTLFDLPAADLSDMSLGFNIFASGLDIGLTLLVYVMIMAFSLLILVVFVSVCLALHFRQAKHAPNEYSSSVRPRTLQIHTRRRLRTSAWCLLILVLLALQVAFGVILFIEPGFVLWSAISQIN